MNPICENIGNYRTASYTIGDMVVRKQVLVGQVGGCIPGANDCLGRCGGKGCLSFPANKMLFTQECLNYGQCLRDIDDDDEFWVCHDEAVAAKPGLETEKDCAVMTGEWHDYNSPLWIQLHLDEKNAGDTRDRQGLRRHVGGVPADERERREGRAFVLSHVLQPLGSRTMLRSLRRERAGQITGLGGTLTWSCSDAEWLWGAGRTGGWPFTEPTP